MSLKIENHSAATTAESIRTLSPTHFRQDAVLVGCRSISEHRALLALALQALKDGHVREITDYSKSGRLIMRIEFRPPPVSMEEVLMQNE